MRVKPLQIPFIMPTRSTDKAGAYDIYMPESGTVSQLYPTAVQLGFAAEVPDGHIALLLPRSGVGAKYGLELHNTCGVIDSDYRGPWVAVLKTKGELPCSWVAGDRLLQFLIIPVANVQLEQVDELNITARDHGSFGSTGH